MSFPHALSGNPVFLNIYGFPIKTFGNDSILCVGGVT